MVNLFNINAYRFGIGSIALHSVYGVGTVKDVVSPRFRNIEVANYNDEGNLQGTKIVEINVDELKVA